MPFARKFRAMMDFPFAGDTLGDFTVESVAVRDDPDAPGCYAYSVRMTLRGPSSVTGGEQWAMSMMSAVLRMIPSPNRKPAASEASSPGVLMVTAIVVSSRRGPNTRRISSGSSVVTTSWRENFPPSLKASTGTSRNAYGVG